MGDPRKQIEVYNEVCGLLDAATAKLQPIISDQSMPEATRNYLMSIWRGIGVERRQLFEVERATHELVDCHCEGLSHDRECLAAPVREGRHPHAKHLQRERPAVGGHRPRTDSGHRDDQQRHAPPSRPPPSTDRTPSAVCSTTTFAAATPMP